MGVYSEYLDRSMSFPELTAERKLQLRRISEARGGRDVLVYAADLNTGNAPTSIDYSDLLPISDQLANQNGQAIDVILETPGGSGEVAEDIVRLLRTKYQDVAFLVPGCAKSAGTIIAMAGDDILMGPASALGPIDAQLFWQGKVFSAEALLEGINKIKDEVTKTGTLNKAYIPLLQAISPGELQSAQNALDFARALVREWLVEYKFKNWETHSSTGRPVTDEEKRQRADEIAAALCAHKRWLTHGRSIKMEDLRKLRVLITDFTESEELSDAVQRYHTLLQMTFSSNIYKVIETPLSQIYRFSVQGGIQQQQAQPSQSDQAVIELECGRCKQKSQVQANLGQAQPIQEGHHPFPADNTFKCPNCGNEIDLSDTRRQLEAQTRKSVVT